MNKFINNNPVKCFGICILFAAGLSLACGDANAASSRKVGSYFTADNQKNGFRLKSVDQAGVAGKLNYLYYAFENIYLMPDGTYRCDNGRDQDNQDLGLGMNGTLDYATQYAGTESVSGKADTSEQKLAGNFNQIKQLKARHSELKVLVSLGGWTWSRWFSAAATTDHLRRTLVSSCIDLYIKGNLPLLNGYGGAGAAAGVFDGIDIDWELPGSPDGMAYNTVSANDKHNFTLLLAEFRRQLSAVTKKTRKKYYLTAAMSTKRESIDQTEPAQYIRSLDWVNLMTYDFHGAWEKTGPSDFQSNLYSDPKSPDKSALSIDSVVDYLTHLGVPPGKLVIGVPFYGRGWIGVPNVNNGLYQPATAPTPGGEEGVLSYRELARLGLTKFYHPVTHQLWTYDEGTFWTYDDAAVIKLKVDYVRRKKLGGMMSWSLEQDDAQFTLSKEMLKTRERNSKLRKAAEISEIMFMNGRKNTNPGK